MANSPRMIWPYPAEGADPWYESFENMVDAQDASVFALQEAKNILPSGGGTFSWNAATGLLSWDATLYFNSSNSGYLESVVAGSLLLPDDGNLVYARYISAPQENLTLILRVVSTLPPSDPDRTFVLCRRAGSRIVFRNGAVLQSGQSAKVIEDGPASTVTSTTTYRVRGSTFGVTDKLNFVGPVPVAGTAGGGVSNIELQLAADSVQVTTTPYFFSSSYRNFYVNRVSATDFYLPAASTVTGQYLVIKTLNQPVTIHRDGANTIDGATTYTLTTQYDSVLLHSGTLDSGATWNWYVITKSSAGSGGGSTFTLPTGGGVSVGNLVAVGGSGNAIQADSTVLGSYPALGVCTSVVGSTVYVQPSGSSGLFAGLTAGTTYYLGTSGTVASAPPMGAVVAQTVLQAYSASAGVLMTGSPVVFL